MKKIIVTIIIVFLLIGCSEENQTVEVNKGQNIELPANYELVADSSMFIGVEMYGLYVNGKAIVYMEDQTSINQVLEAVKDASLINNVEILSHEIEENIEIKHEKVDVFDSRIRKSIEGTIKYILNGQPSYQYHIVEIGDNFWDISIRYKITVQELLDMNPHITAENFNVGTELVISTHQAYINTVTITQEDIIEIIPFGIGEDVPTDTYYMGEYKIMQKGVDGQVALVKEIYYRNGLAYGSKELTRTVLKEPVQAIYYKGTKSKN